MKAKMIQAIFEADPDYELYVTVVDPVSGEYYDAEVASFRVDELTQTCTLELYEEIVSGGGVEDDQEGIEDEDPTVSELVIDMSNKENLGKVINKTLGGKVTNITNLPVVVIPPKEIPPRLDVKML